MKQYNKINSPYWIGAKKKGFIYLILAGVLTNRKADPDFEGIVKVMNVISGNVYDIPFEDYEKANLSGNLKTALKNNSDYDLAMKHLDKDFKEAWSDANWNVGNFNKLVENKLYAKRDDWRVKTDVEVGDWDMDTSDEAIPSSKIEFRDGGQYTYKESSVEKEIDFYLGF